LFGWVEAFWIFILNIAIVLFIMVSAYNAWQNTNEIKKELKEIKELLKQKDINS